MAPAEHTVTVPCHPCRCALLLVDRARSQPLPWGGQGQGQRTAPKARRYDWASVVPVLCTGCRDCVLVSQRRSGRRKCLGQVSSPCSPTGHSPDHETAAIAWGKNAACAFAGKPPKLHRLPLQRQHEPTTQRQRNHKGWRLMTPGRTTMSLNLCEATHSPASPTIFDFSRPAFPSSLDARSE